jgi:peptidoglycan/LPS O-acetylase OafA/YrhL
VNWYASHAGWLPANWGILWPLSIEEMFYVIAPVACLFIRRDFLLIPLLVALALLLPCTRAALAGNEIWQEKAYLPAWLPSSPACSPQSSQSACARSGLALNGLCYGCGPSG